MRIILLTVQFKPKNLRTPWPEHAMLSPERCSPRMQHPLPASGPPTFMAYAGRWVPSVNSLDRLRRPLRPLHGLNPAHSHSSHSLALATHALQPGTVARPMSAATCGANRGYRSRASSAAATGPGAHLDAHVPHMRVSAGALARLKPYCASNAPAGAWMFQSSMSQLNASEINMADSCVGSGAAAGTNVLAKHLLACAAVSECADYGVARQGLSHSCGGRRRRAKLYSYR